MPQNFISYLCFFLTECLSINLTLSLDAEFGKLILVLVVVVLFQLTEIKSNSDNEKLCSLRISVCLTSTSVCPFCCPFLCIFQSISLKYNFEGFQGTEKNHFDEKIPQFASSIKILIKQIFCTNEKQGERVSIFHSVGSRENEFNISTASFEIHSLWRWRHEVFLFSFAEFFY